MQLFEELPSLVAMFLIGVVGYVTVEMLKKYAALSAWQRQKLDGLYQAKATSAAAGTAKTIQPSDFTAASEGTSKQVHEQPPNSQSARLRKKKAIRKSRKEPVPCSIDVDRAEGAAPVAEVDVRSLPETEPTELASGTSTVGQCPLSVVPTELPASSVQEEYSNVRACVGYAATTEGDNDAEIDDNVEAEVDFASKTQEPNDNDDCKQPRDCRANAEEVCQQPGLHYKEKSQIKGDSMEVSQHLIAPEISEVLQQLEEERDEDKEKEREGHDEDDVKLELEEENEQLKEEREEEKQEEEEEGGQDEKVKQNKEVEESDEPQDDVKLKLEESEQLEQEMDQPQTAPPGEGQYKLCEPTLDEWPETSDDDSMDNNYFSYQDEHLPAAAQHKPLWADADDEAEHESYLHALNWSGPQFGAVMKSFDDDSYLPVDSCSGDLKQGGQQEDDNWMTPFALVDGEMPGMSSGHECMSPSTAVTDWLSGPEEDFWMTPFDELIQKREPLHIAASDASTAPSVSSPLGPAVCIWNAAKSTTREADDDSPKENDAPEVFTDGQQVFQPVPSATGQPLFTDGKQLYASVCVIFGPPGGDAASPSSDMACDASVCASARAQLPLSPGSNVTFTADCSDDETPPSATIED